MTLNRTQHPPYHKIEHIDFPIVQKISLDNGLPIYILKGGSQPVLKLDVMVNAGAMFTNKKLVSPLASLMLNEGTKSKTAHEIAEIFDFYGAYFQPIVEKDIAFCGLVSLNRHFEKTLPLFTEVLTESNFPEKEAATLIERRRQNYLVEREKTSFLARELFHQQLFGAEHPYGLITVEEEYNQTKVGDLFDFYKKHYQPGNFTLLLSGHVTNEAISLINKYFGNLPSDAANPVPKIEPELGITSEPIISIKENAVQSSIRMGLLTINKTHKDYLGLKILVTILGGYFGSRLMKNIREDKGYTYGIHSMLVSLHNAGYMGIAADVKAEHTRDAIGEIRKEMEKLKVNEISMQELQLVQNYMMGEMLQMFDGPFATSDTFKSMLQYNIGMEYFEKMKQTILGITPHELQILAQNYFDADKLITAVAGKFE